MQNGEVIMGEEMCSAGIVLLADVVIEYIYW